MSSRSEPEHQSCSQARDLRIVVNCIGATGGGIVRVLGDLVAELAKENSVALYLAPPSTSFAQNVQLIARQSLSRVRTLLRCIVDWGSKNRWSADIRIDIAPGIAPAIRGSKRITIVHDLAFRDASLRYISTPQRVYRRLVMAWSVRRSDLVVAVSQATVDELLDFRPKVHRKLLMLPLPPSSVFTEAEEIMVEGPVNSIAGRVRVLAFAHGLNKGVDLLIDLLDYRNDIDLVLVSPKSFWETSPYASRLRAERYSDRFEIHSSVDDATLIGLYRRVQVFCMPSRYEGYGLPVAEALSLGVPTVISALPVLTATGRGYAISMGGNRAEDLAVAIDRALAMPSAHWSEARNEFRKWDWRAWMNQLLARMN